MIWRHADSIHWSQIMEARIKNKAKLHKIVRIRGSIYNSDATSLKQVFHIFTFSHLEAIWDIFDWHLIMSRNLNHFKLEFVKHIQLFGN